MTTESNDQDETDDVPEAMTAPRPMLSVNIYANLVGYAALTSH